MENSQEISKKLFKSRQNRIIDGVCGGIGEYFDVDPIIVRVLWVLLTLLGGSGLILYIIAMIIMPSNPEHVGKPQSETMVAAGPDRRRYWGIVLILVGVFVLIERTEMFAGISLWGFSKTFLFPISLIVIGLMFIYVHTRKDSAPAPATGTAADASSPLPTRELRRSIHDKKVCGVCGGLAQYFHYDSTLVRILFVFLILASFGWGIPLYVILCLFIPAEKTETVSI